MSLLYCNVVIYKYIKNVKLRVADRYDSDDFSVRLIFIFGKYSISNYILSSVQM